MKHRAPRVAAVTSALATLCAMSGEAHKPITSKYTFNEHVLPIFRGHCTPCHVDGGAAPMSLTAYADARPWAESIRAEVVSAHMPPGQAESGVGSFVNARHLSPRELDIVLTWATGGTPEGPTPADSPAVAALADWPMGVPDLTIPVPSAVTLPARTVETTEEFLLRSPALEGRAIRAVDLRPGTPAVVRRAVIYIRTRQPSPTQPPLPERVIAIWAPDRSVVSHDNYAAFALPNGAELVARITYRKTWKYENIEVTDRSVVGVYFADSQHAREILAVPVSANAVIADDLQAVAIRSDVEGQPTDVTLTAILPDGSRRSMIRFTADREWPQRFWYEKAVALPRGTRLESSVSGITLDVVRIENR